MRLKFVDNVDWLTMSACLCMRVCHNRATNTDGTDGTDRAADALCVCRKITEPCVYRSERQHKTHSSRGQLVVWRRALRKRTSAAYHLNAPPPSPSHTHSRRHGQQAASSTIYSYTTRNVANRHKHTHTARAEPNELRKRHEPKPNDRGPNDRPTD